jgi:hypothetical protein
MVDNNCVSTKNEFILFHVSITVVIFSWLICLISESMGHHHGSEIMDDGSID